MTGYKFENRDTILYGRKCEKCGIKSHIGSLHKDHWYCSNCRPLDEDELKIVTRSVLDDLNQQNRDDDYRKQLRRHKLQIPKELI